MRRTSYQVLKVPNDLVASKPLVINKMYIPRQLMALLRVAGLPDVRCGCTTF